MVGIDAVCDGGGCGSDSNVFALPPNQRVVGSVCLLDETLDVGTTYCRHPQWERSTQICSSLSCSPLLFVLQPFVLCPAAADPYPMLLPAQTVSAGHDQDERPCDAAGSA